MTVKNASPTGSLRSTAPSRSGTWSRPPPPPKPSHLASAFTGTCNSIALRHYIQTHTTGGSITTHSPSTATISRARLGHGYDSSSADHFVDAFDTSSDDEDDSQIHTLSRPSGRGRTYTAPSVSRLFDASSDAPEFGNGTTRLIRNEPIAIDGCGPSRVSNLRGMFEAAMPTASTPVALSRQNTGLAAQHTGNRAKPRISNQVRMLQAQITGDRFNGLAGAFNVAETRSSIVMETPQRRRSHRRDITDHSEDDSVYRTATSDLLGDALKMDAVVIPPSSNTDTIKASSSSGSFASIDVLSKQSGDADIDIATFSRSSSTKTGLTSSRIRTITAQHERDDSSATVRPSQSNMDATEPSDAPRYGSINSADSVTGTARRISTRLVSGGKKGRLSSIFTASPQSSDLPTSGSGRDFASLSPSPSAHSVSASEAPTEAERSREPSMLVADDDDISFSAVSHHLRANDGSCFDLDPRGSNASPSKSASIRRVGLNPTLADHDGPVNDGSAAPREREDDKVDAGTQEASRATRNDIIEPAAHSSPQRRPSIVIDSELASSGAVDSAADAGKVETVTPSALSVVPTTRSSFLTTPTASTFQASRPISARMLPPGIGKPARALYDFEGEAAFNELAIRAGQSFDILNEELAGGWSLGIVWGDDGVPRRGLIPQGWYCLVHDFTRSPEVNQGVKPSPTLDDAETPGPPESVSLPPFDSISRDESASQAAAVEQFLGLSSGSKQSSSKLSPQPTMAKVIDQSEALSITIDNVSSPNGSKASDQADANAGRVAVRPTSAGSMASISVSAFLRTDEPAAQRPQVDAEALKTVDDRLAAPDDPVRAPASPRLAIDGMPAASDRDNPIDWSAVNAAPSPLVEAAVVPSEPALSDEPVTLHTQPGPNAETAVTNGSDWKGSIFGKKTFNRFASFVTSGAEDYVLSNSNTDGDERSRNIARKASGGQPTGGMALALTEVTEEDHDVAEDAPAGQSHRATEDQDAPNAASEVELSAADPNQHFVIPGPAGPKWKSKTAPFLVQVHHPEKRTKLNGMQEYTIYYVTSTYPAEDQQEASISGGHGCIPYDPLGGPHPPGAQVTVVRRFTQFEWLYQVLTKHYSALLIPPLPEKQYSGRFASDFIETRRADLEMWMSRLVRHPVLRYSDAIRFFLSCEDEVAWRRYAADLLRDGFISQISNDKRTKGGVFAQTWHPEFNFDSTEAALEADRMEAFLKASERTIHGVGGHNAGKQGVLAAYKGHRVGNVATSSTYRDLSYTLLRTITGAGAGPSDSQDAALSLTDEEAHRIHGPPMGNVGRRSNTGAANEHGAWCWREDCQDCLNLTSALQNTAECMQNVADIYESHARETLLRQQERFKEISRPYTMAQTLLETHRTTLTRYREATHETDPWGGDSDDDTAVVRTEDADAVAARCETVLNVTLSEIDRLHDERVQDYHALSRAFLDGEIELYESILDQLRAARLHYEEEYYEREADFHILASRYQPELSRPKKPSAPLLMPSAPPGPTGGLRSVGLLISQAKGGVGRPVSADRSPMAVDEGKGGFLGSILGKELHDRTNVVHHGAGEERKGGNERQSRAGSYFGAIWR